MNCSWEPSFYDVHTEGASGSSERMSMGGKWVRSMWMSQEILEPTDVVVLSSTQAKKLVIFVFGSNKKWKLFVNIK